LLRGFLLRLDGAVRVGRDSLIAFAGARSVFERFIDSHVFELTAAVQLEVGLADGMFQVLLMRGGR